MGMAEEDLLNAPRRPDRRRAGRPGRHREAPLARRRGMRVIGFTPPRPGSERSTPSALAVQARASARA